LEEEERDLGEIVCKAEEEAVAFLWEGRVLVFFSSCLQQQQQQQKEEEEPLSKKSDIALVRCGVLLPAYGKAVRGDEGCENNWGKGFVLGRQSLWRCPLGGRRQRRQGQ